MLRLCAGGGDAHESAREGTHRQLLDVVLLLRVRLILPSSYAPDPREAPGTATPRTVALQAVRRIYRASEVGSPNNNIPRSPVVVHEVHEQGEDDAAGDHSAYASHNLVPLKLDGEGASVCPLR